jgi:GNAT superfamily N-acetyltransferase
MPKRVRSLHLLFARVYSVRKGDMMGIVVHTLEKEEIKLLAEGFSAHDKNKSVQLFEQYLQAQQDGELICLVANVDGNDVGYLTICWNSPYDSFSKRAIPEIKDLNVLPHYRGKGYAARLMAHAEEIVSEKSNFAGIGVGLSSEYGTAQRMYIRRGYIPDGFGLMYKYQKVDQGSRVKVDDNLMIMLTKRLNTSEEEEPK